MADRGGGMSACCVKGRPGPSYLFCVLIWYCKFVTRENLWVLAGVVAGTVE